MVKPTDARRYLNYRSHHPKHAFKSIVYSQALRIHRIVSDPEILKVRLDELAVAFAHCDYPYNLVSNILADVLKKERTINYIEKTHDSPFLIPWISTFVPVFLKLMQH